MAKSRQARLKTDTNLKRKRERERDRLRVTSHSLLKEKESLVYAVDALISPRGHFLVTR